MANEQKIKKSFQLVREDIKDLYLKIGDMVDRLDEMKLVDVSLADKLVRKANKSQKKSNKKSKKKTKVQIRRERLKNLRKAQRARKRQIHIKKERLRNLQKARAARKK